MKRKQRREAPKGLLEHIKTERRELLATVVVAFVMALLYFPLFYILYNAANP